MKTIKIAKEKKKPALSKRDSRQLRCANPNCNTLISQTSDGKGDRVHHCPSCGTKFYFSDL